MRMRISITDIRECECEYSVFVFKFGANCLWLDDSFNEVRSILICYENYRVDTNELIWPNLTEVSFRSRRAGLYVNKTSEFWG